MEAEKECLSWEIIISVKSHSSNNEGISSVIYGIFLKKKYPAVCSIDEYFTEKMISFITFLYIHKNKVLDVWKFSASGFRLFKICFHVLRCP